ncbi:MAG: hypothetical protein U0167_11475 [bacterium]
MAESVVTRPETAGTSGSAQAPPTPDQEKAAFYVAGRRGDAGLPATSGLGLRPALMARVRRLSELRHDFPLILADVAEPEACVVPLSGLFDGILENVAVGDDAERIRHHGLRLEREIRERSGRGAGRRLSELWQAAERELADSGDASLDDSLARLRGARKIDGLVLACEADSPQRFFEHVWERVQQQRVAELRARIDRLAFGLAAILQAEEANSAAGLSRDRLRASVGTAFAEELDFGALARVLTESRPSFSLSDARRERVRRLLSVLESQRFCAKRDVRGRPTAGAYEFVHHGCAAAIDAYRERFSGMVEVAKAMVMAELEVDGRYRETVHDALFEAWDVTGVDAAELAAFPDYLVCVDAATLSAPDSVKLLEALSAGLPLKVLVVTHDLAERSVVQNGRPSSGLPAKQLASAALAEGSAYVLQATASHLHARRAAILRGLSVRGPALFAVYSGASEELPGYLASAAALESRAFPAFTYDPTAGTNWAARFSLDGNPQCERDWPVRTLTYEDESVQRVSVDVAFTIVDFLACDPRTSEHLALASEEAAGAMVPVAERVAAGDEGVPDRLPYVLMVDNKDQLRRVLVDGRLIRLARRGLERWRSLQELGGVHNSHAERLLAVERTAWEEERARLDADARKSDVAVAATPATVPAAAAPAAPAPSAEAPPAPDPDLARVETPRCSTCNECIQINDRMFKYNENKQAYLADPDAGTYAQLVQAAESCQVAIIHPGKPRNPAEPGLDELIQRAEKFR